MQLTTEFVRLPLTFDVQRLADEIAKFDEAAWKPHPQGYPGNSALSLIAVEGDPHDDAVAGPMKPTPHLEHCPYLRQVLAAFEAVWGRTRLMRIDAESDVTPHADTNYYWLQHARVHIPIVTTADVRFLCGKKSAHMAAGEAWIFDTWQTHSVLNPHDAPRIHLVADTVGSAAFWELVERGIRGEAPRHVAYDPLRVVPLATESVNTPAVLSPAEQQEVIDLLVASLPPGDHDALLAALDQLRRDWRAAWARFGTNQNGFELYRRLIARTKSAIEALPPIRLTNGVMGANAIHNSLLMASLQDARPEPRRQTATTSRPRRIERPIFIVSPPRSGSTLFFETLAQSPTVWTIGGESHAVIERIPGLNPEDKRFHSNRLTESDATPGAVMQLEEAFIRQLRNRAGQAPRAGATGLRLLEKTPKNSLRVPFLAEAFPDALFLYLYRDMRDTISSMLDAWRSGRFVTYPQLPEWEGPTWSLLLTPGWRDLAGRPLAEIVAAQWANATRYLLDDLEQLAPDRWLVASYDALTGDPRAEIERIAAFTGIEWDRELDGPLPLSRSTLTKPDREKWKRNAADLDIALPLVAEVAARARRVFAEPPRHSETPSTRSPRATPIVTSASTGSAQQPFASVHTESFPELLEKAASSLLVSTYQSGRLIAVRAIDGKLNTHLRLFPSPMGIARHGATLALGTKQFVWQFRHHAGLAEKMEGGRTDAVFVPISARATGDIRIHELAYGGNELFFVNTRFSCLSTLDRRSSFAVHWKPRFISKLVPEDRCHLNGMAMVDGAPRFVTALGESDEKAGWRETKSSGGIVIDVQSDEIIARGLSMPHSPRWHDGKLWVLESGEGRLCTTDPATGAITVVAEVPGFARGLAFAGRYAIIGLSQVRESVFDGIPIAKRTDRSCGVWIVDTTDGAIAGFLRFEGVVQEIFDIQLLAGIRHPEVLEPNDELVGAGLMLPADVMQ